MNFTKRYLLAAAAALTLATGLPLESAQAKTIKFTESSYKQHLKSGKPFMVGVHTDWCSTCARQKRIINGLRSEGAPYKNLTVLEMEWDTYRGSKLGKKLRIPRRSTLIMYKKGKEVGRIIAGTSTASIKKLINKGY